MQFYIVRRESQGYLAVMPHPDAAQLPEQVAGLRRRGVAVLVSLLQTHERDSLGLADTGHLCARQGIEYLSHPVEDLQVPTDSEAFAKLALALKDRLLAGTGIAIHCRAGIGRSGLLAASVLVACGFTPAEAFAEISAARGASVPEVPAQGLWLQRHRKLLVLG
ncbi:MAG: protein tyrosine phosphatase [Gammaproteobacteria bacterium]|nr:protein tyrosine phosphatase [Gammaproteobacteria bacterium]